MQNKSSALLKGLRASFDGSNACPYLQKQTYILILRELVRLPPVRDGVTWLPRTERSRLCSLVRRLIRFPILISNPGVYTSLVRILTTLDVSIAFYLLALCYIAIKDTKPTSKFGETQHSLHHVFEQLHVA